MATGTSAAEKLGEVAFDAEEFVDEKARLRIFDRDSGGWGHTDVDDFRQADDRGDLPLALIRWT